MIETLPASIDSERSILGAILMDNRVLRDDGTVVSSDDFSLDAHRRIFCRMLDLAEASQAIDLITLTETLRAQKELDAVGGAVYVMGLTTGLPARPSIAHYCRIVREKAALRKLINLAELLAVKAQSQESSSIELVQLMQDQCLKMALESSAGARDLFIDISDFCRGEDVKTDWLVEGFIEKGSNGIIAADPKGAKSISTACLAVSLALGVPWLGLSVSRRVRTAIVSREDNPETTKRRLRQIVNGKSSTMQELKGWLHVNSKEQTSSLMLDNAREVNELIRSIQKWQSEFVIFDVFNKMHSQDENDNTKVRAVMNQIDRIQAETGAQMCVLHHWNKGDTGQSLTRRVRGAGAIAGFAEWIAGIELVDEAHQVRRMSFETKVGAYLPPIHYQIEDDFPSRSIKFRVTAPEDAPQTQNKFRGAQ